MDKKYVLFAGSLLFLLVIGVGLGFLKLEISVSSGTGITVYEQTGKINEYDYNLNALVNGEQSFSMADEECKVDSDGNYLKIVCFRDQHYSGTQTGNNIVAVRLNGIAGYPNGIWASKIKSYKIGYDGIEESRFNALGDVFKIGPYGNSKCTYLGDQQSEIVLGFELPFYQAIGLKF
jgi:hypothetical protein